MTTSWSPQQETAIARVVEWLAHTHVPSNPQVFFLAGYAGTGKSTLARHLAGSFRNPVFAAFTGKAASVLREKGCAGATTLHSLMYKVNDRDKSKLNELRQRLLMMSEEDPDRREALFDFEEEKKKASGPLFSLNPESKLTFADLIIVDEVSMVDERLGRDLLSFGKPILVLGDPAQLPPIAGGGFFTNAAPDMLLTEIHRQALDNPILKWATMVRQGEIVPYGLDGAANKFRRESVDDAWLAKSAGQILTGKNETRMNLNARVRKALGRTDPFPVFKDTLVFLKNDHRKGILNGTLCRAQSNETLILSDGTACMNLLYEGKILFDQVVDPCPFLGKECDIESHRHLVRVDYGYALTVHKAQGSQWDAVTVWDDRFQKRDPTQRQRWLYTAITRAAKTLNIVTS